jgi:hypothetical protein
MKRVRSRLIAGLAGLGILGLSLTAAVSPAQAFEEILLTSIFADPPPAIAPAGATISSALTLPSTFVPIAQESASVTFVDATNAAKDVFNVTFRPSPCNCSEDLAFSLTPGAPAAGLTIQETGDLQDITSLLAQQLPVMASIAALFDVRIEVKVDDAVAAVTEPATLAMLGLPALLLVWARRRKATRWLAMPPARTA